METIIIIMKELMNPLLLIGFAVASVYYYFTSTFDFWSKRDVPYKKPTIILGNFGDLLLFRKSQPEGIREMYNWFEDARFFGVFRVRSAILILRDPELVKHVCVKDFPCFTNRGIPVNTTDALSGNLFNIEGKAWKSLRSKLTPAFSSAKMRRMFYLLMECHEQLTKLIDDTCRVSNVMEVRELATKFTIDVIGSCAFGIRMNALKDDDDSNAFRCMAMRLSRPSYKATLWRMLRTALPTLYRLLGVQVIDGEVTAFFKNVVSQMIKQREKELGPKRHDFMDLLIQLKNEGSLDRQNGGANDGETMDTEGTASASAEFSDNAIAAQAFVFFAAGNETSSNTISFCLHELALNKDVQERARREIHDEIEKSGGILTYEAVQAMKYLDMIVLETLRKYPPAPLLSRRCEYSYKIPDTEVLLPAGTRVVIPIYGIHHDPRYYPEPDKFDPERFTDQNKSSRHSYTYLPFGEGPRNCIGMRFALLQTKMGIISFLRKHRISKCEKTTVPIRFSRRSLVLSSEGGFWLEIRKIV